MSKIKTTVLTAAIIAVSSSIAYALVLKFDKKCNSECKCEASIATDGRELLDEGQGYKIYLEGTEK